MFTKTKSKILNDIDRLIPFSSKSPLGDIFGHNRDNDSLDSRGSAAALSEYSFDQMTYPLDLMSDDKSAYAPYMMIFINAPQGSTLSKNKVTEFQISDETVKPHNKIRDGSSIRAGLTKDMAVGASGTASVFGGGLAGVLGIPVAGAAGAGASILGTAAMNSYIDGSTFNTEPKRLKSAIALHMPNQLDIRYGMSYRNDSATPFMAFTKLAGQAIDTAAGVVERASNMVNGAGTVGDDTGFKGIAAQVKSGLGNVTPIGVNAALQLMPGGDTISAASKLAPNPKIQTVFEGVDPRQFSFGYTFFARSEDELENIHRILKTLKYYMHPQYKDKDQFLFIYPGTFDIEYYVGAEENRYLHKHTSCVLTNLSVDYTPNGIYAFFNKNGAPVQINVRMDFRELEVLTAQDIDNNY